MSCSRKRLGICLATLFVLLAGSIAVLMAYAGRSDEVRLRLGEGEYAVRVVSSGAERTKGLSGTTSLPKDQGMLFVFDADGRWGIWMKDMNYPIDILWLDRSKTVIDMVENASPASYPSTTFKPKVPARYVLELAAGSIADASIVVGNRATFDLEAGDMES